MAFKMGEKPQKSHLPNPGIASPNPGVAPEPVVDPIVDEEFVDEYAHLNGALAKGAAVGADSVPAPVEAASTAPQANTDAMAQLASMIGAQVAAAVTAAQPVKRMTFGEYMRRENKGRSKLRRISWENGVLHQESVLSNREIDLINQVTHTGRYVNRLVEVIVREDGADEVVEFRWNMKRDAQFELKGYARNFCDILEQVVAAQAEERAAAEAKEDRATARRQQRA